MQRYSAFINSINAPRLAVLLCSLLLGGALLAQPVDLLKRISGYDVVWHSPSENAAGSMPCGGGDIGLNVWVEKGDLLFYISQSGTFDENNQMLKAGRVRVHFPANHFGDGSFTQQLHLADGYVSIESAEASVQLWVDVFHPVIHVDATTRQPEQVLFSFEDWRYTDRTLSGAELRGNSYKVQQPFPVVTTHDSISFSKNSIVFFHRNPDGQPTIFDRTVHAEGLDAVKDQLYDPVKGNTFGGLITGDKLVPAGTDSGRYGNTPYHAWSLKTIAPLRQHHLRINLYTAQAGSASAWYTALNQSVETARKSERTAREQTRQWWRQYWDRSYIFIDGEDSSIGRNYQLFRYMLGCNAMGKWPTRFNGGLFTFDPQWVNPQYPFSPDFRLWGGGTFTAQNQRLLYYPMLKNGDAAMMKPQFDFYLHLLNNAQLRTRFYWRHGGASFTEQMENFGLPNIFEYGMKRPAGADPGMEYNAWLEYLWETSFEFCFMILEAERYEGMDIHAYLPLIEGCLQFYDEHYTDLAKKRGIKAFDEKGKYIFYPTSAAETYKGAYNSTTVIAAMQVVLSRLLQLDSSYGDTTARHNWRTMLGRVPAIPLREMNGRVMLAPAQAWSRVQNSETPQLYPVFPWGIYGIGRPGLDTAINTFLYDTLALKFRSATGWKQDNIFAARLGLTDEALALTRQKFKDGPHRFPAFWGPGFDWTPDHNWGGSAMIGLQEMLMQADGKKIYLLPAWPADWSGAFKIHAPYNTIIEGTISKGTIITMDVSPQWRRRDIIIPTVERGGNATK